ncbi:putative protein serine/threonine kinase [Cavenderia fasciculata]|uniref:non-specific serine/threonine protein kinase n=1 Tax=Cavenderia fasciculata TaxID=261658 RepID=F4PIH7_CACFS|nr:putative protein serine/threonine kinase [Cavenderia fasciculata]EGG25406.1 putative protein serine/threonine kinase [Cavenderia fasciculata]|eukprot:XP_004363257.1 putative protein serine/threonine kinase [Cavenderia fasciculata]
MERVYDYLFKNRNSSRMGDVEEFFKLRISKDDPELIFQIVEVVGSGSFGTVCACRWMKKKDRDAHGNKLIACKFVEVTAEDIETNTNLVKEIDILKESIDCPYIVEYKGCYLKSNMLLIVMEYCKGGSLLDIIELCKKSLKEEEIAAVCAGVVKGLVYLHSKRTTHRDIKAGNVLLDEDGVPKLADFGVSTIAEQGQKMKTVIGSPYWMAPEIIMGQGYDQKADIWSLGITAIEIAEGVPPRFDIPPSRVIFTIPHQPPPTLKIQSDWSPEFHDFIKICLSMNPSLRPSAQQLLSHPFILKGSSQQILQSLVTECIPLLKIKREEKIQQMEESDQAAESSKKAESLKGSVVVLNSNTRTASIMRNKNGTTNLNPPAGAGSTGSGGSVAKPQSGGTAKKPAAPSNNKPSASAQVPPAKPGASASPSPSTAKKPAAAQPNTPATSKTPGTLHTPPNYKPPQAPATTTTTASPKSPATAKPLASTTNKSPAHPISPSVKPNSSTGRSQTISIGQQKQAATVKSQDDEPVTFIHHDDHSGFQAGGDEEDIDFHPDDYEEVDI